MMLTHPTLAHVTVDVPDQDATRWQASGWLAPHKTPAKITKPPRKRTPRK